MKGLLIAVCGLDGSGKTTQITLLKKWFEEVGEKVFLTRQPTDMYRNDIRVRNYLDHGRCKNMKSIALLSAADRLWHMAEEIQPTLDNGIHVLSDRYLFSSYAFFKARGLELSYLRKIYEDVRMPDLTIFLDLEPETALLRVLARDGKENMKYEENDSSIFEHVRLVFREVLPQNALVIDAEQESEVIHKMIVERISNLLNKGAVL